MWLVPVERSETIKRERERQRKRRGRSFGDRGVAAKKVGSKRGQRGRRTETENDTKGFSRSRDNVTRRLLEIVWSIYPTVKYTQLGEPTSYLGVCTLFIAIGEKGASRITYATGYYAL